MTYPSNPVAQRGCGTPAARIQRLTSMLVALGYNEPCAATIAYRKAYGRTLFPNEQADADAVNAADCAARGIPLH